MIAKGPIVTLCPSFAEGWTTASGWIFTCVSLGGEKWRRRPPAGCRRGELDGRSEARECFVRAGNSGHVDISVPPQVGSIPPRPSIEFLDLATTPAQSRVLVSGADFDAACRREICRPISRKGTRARFNASGDRQTLPGLRGASIRRSCRVDSPLAILNLNSATRVPLAERGVYNPFKLISNAEPPGNMATNEQLYGEAEKLKDAGDLEGAAKKLEELLAQDANYAWPTRLWQWFTHACAGMTRR